MLRLECNQEHGRSALDIVCCEQGCLSGVLCRVCFDAHAVASTHARGLLLGQTAIEFVRKWGVFMLQTVDWLGESVRRKGFTSVFELKVVNRRNIVCNYKEIASRELKLTFERSTHTLRQAISAKMEYGGLLADVELAGKSHIPSDVAAMCLQGIAKQFEPLRLTFMELLKDSYPQKTVYRCLEVGWARKTLAELESRYNSHDLRNYASATIYTNADGRDLRLESIYTPAKRENSQLDLDSLGWSTSMSFLSPSLKSPSVFVQKQHDWQREKEDLVQSIATANSTIGHQQQKINELYEELKSKDKLLLAQKKESEEETARNTIKFEGEKTGLLRQKHKLEVDGLRLMGELSLLNEKCARIESTLASFEVNISDLQIHYDQIDKELDAKANSETAPAVPTTGYYINPMHDQSEEDLLEQVIELESEALGQRNEVNKLAQATLSVLSILSGYQEELSKSSRMSMNKKIYAVLQEFKSFEKYALDEILEISESGISTEESTNNETKCQSQKKLANLGNEETSILCKRMSWQMIME